ncbi:DUF1893 domain-containing protein [Thermoproteota archaeon]
MNPDFSKYSLALIKDNKVVFSSEKSGLRPLLECVLRFKSGREEIKDCILHDKVIGLAAARIIMYSAMVSHVFTRTSSRPAKSLLEKNGIPVDAQETVGNIMNNEKSSICPMELKAISIEDNELFFQNAKDVFGL